MTREGGPSLVSFVAPPQNAPMQRVIGRAIPAGRHSDSGLLHRGLTARSSPFSADLLHTSSHHPPPAEGVNAVKALYWSAVINGLLAPLLLVAILLVAVDRKLMGGQPSSRLGDRGCLRDGAPDGEGRDGMFIF
jgi:hypothetical protein